MSSVEYTTNASTSGSGHYQAGSWTITPSDAFGSGLSNYTITYDGGTLTITPAALSVSSFAAANKTYNANTAATITNDGSLSGSVYLGDTVSLNTSGAAASFASATVGSGKTVTGSGFALSGSDAGDYSVTQPTTTANITVASLTITASSATLTYGSSDEDFTATGLLGSDAVSSVTMSSNATTSGSGHWNVGTWTATPSQRQRHGTVQLHDHL